MSSWDPVFAEKSVAVKQNNVSATNSSTQLMHFVFTMDDLLTGLHEFFPECPRVKDKLDKFRALVKGADTSPEMKGHVNMVGAKMLIDDWHTNMRAHYADCQSRNIEPILNSDLKIVTDLDLKTKWVHPEFDQESKENMFKYIDILNMASQIYHTIPHGVMQRIESVAQSIVLDMSQGKANIDIMAIGRQVIDNMSEQDMTDMQENINMSDLMGIMNLSMGMMRESMGEDNLVIPPELQQMMNQLNKM